MSTRKNTKQKIIDISLNLFSTKGYDGTSIRQIAREVGIRESGIYNHFSSKEKIFKTIISNFKKSTVGSEIINDELIEELVRPYNFMKNFVTKLINHWNTKNEKKFIRLMLMEQFREIDGEKLSMSNYLNETKSIWWMIFDELIKHKVIKNFDPVLLSHEFIAPLYFIRIEYLVQDNVDNLDVVLDLVNKHVDFFWQSVKR
jgi:AcrR family transcriptional regulator